MNPWRLLPRLVRRQRRGRTVRWIDAETLADRPSKDSLAIIDVRSPEEFTGPLGHLENAVNIPIGELPGRLTEIKALQGMPVMLVCRTDKRSVTAVALLEDAGFSDLSVLRGGMEQWNRDGRPVGKGGAATAE
ncbi:rhodanese-like domain-containing protein [Nitratireductor sp. ZSWI3]|uniref:rhodanese-like domain-containing protein n=1 Tax=Nitratireductor sp. ZSWI3 TaxID=2966359 RepID=UPI0021500288|nr:rhodanese-like domain-containing protein [Nitratireductor sp. ZSWI3]MCR4266838.1 rhodanese-like domain-containing protein [Nitratireductor sp. ZSWI3]